MSEPIPTLVDLISAAQVVEDQAQSLRDAMETAKHWLTANTQLDASMRFVRAYSILNQALEGRLGDLDQLAKELRESAPPEAAGRPLEAILADIRAEGHENIHLRRHGGTWWLATAIETDRRPNESLQDYLHRNEDKLSWSDADDPGPLAEARLAEIRELHAEKRAALMHYSHYGSSDHPEVLFEGPQHTSDPFIVTCPVCRKYIDQNCIIAGRPASSNIDPTAELVIRPGPEEVDTEHEALAAEDAARELAASEEGQS